MVRKIIKVSVAFSELHPLKIKADAIGAGLFTDDKKITGLCRSLDEKLEGAITKLIRTGDFKGDENTIAVIYTDGKIPAKRIIIAGLGKREKFTLDSIRKASALIADKAVQLKLRSVCLAIHEQAPKVKNVSLPSLAQAVTEGAYFGSYRYDEYVSKDEKESRLDRLAFTIAGAAATQAGPLRKGIRVGNITAAAQSYARTLVNRPANIINPPALAVEARKLARQTPRLSCTVLNFRQLRQKKMGGILAVGGGSAGKPCLMILKYTPAKSSPKTPVVALVGKAITFDSGGISLKHAEGMHEMKFDKSGGIAVLGAMKAIAALKPNIKVIGIIPSAENMPSGTSYRPGDIITTYSGKTVEIQNTDAEGRMILCDALAYAAQLGCGTIIDLATLTGACVVALGQNRAGLMGNDDELIEDIKKASANTGEQVWHMPCDDEYVELMKSKIADLKNVGGKWAGACTAAAFLSQFTGKAKWAHLDIAGPGVFGDVKLNTTGSVAFGVRLLIDFVTNMASK